MHTTTCLTSLQLVASNQDDSDETHEHKETQKKVNNTQEVNTSKTKTN